MRSVVERRLKPGVVDWLGRNWPAVTAPFSTTRFRASFAGVARRIGAQPIGLTGEEMQGLRRGGIVAPERWSLDQLVRVGLLLAAAEMVPEKARPAFVREVYLRGDYREQAAVLRALNLLPDPGSFVELAIDACRTNVTDVFEAIACETPYPAAHFPELNFNQLVIKAVFIGLTLDRIIGLADRNNAELRRIAKDYAAERRAAGRSVPSDLDLIMA
ncbi:MAG: EboA domain-containing protein [Pseudomonadota bacterium]